MKSDTKKTTILPSHSSEMSKDSTIAQIIQAHLAAATSLMQREKELRQAADMMIDCLERNGKILICGNGGSAADAQHFAAELTGRFVRERKALAAVALSTDTSALTAIANDYGFQEVFSRQVKALGRPGDVLVSISTSGDSANILGATNTAHEIGCKTIALTGRSGGKLAELAQLAIRVPGSETARVQELHILTLHILCELIDTHFTSQH